MIAHGGDVHAVDAAAVEAGELARLAEFATLPDGNAHDAAVCVLHQPVVGLRGDDALDATEPAGAVPNGSFFDRLDENLDAVILGFRIAHCGVVPPPHVPVGAGGGDCLCRVVKTHNLDHAFVARLERTALAVRSHEHGTDQTAVPYEERARLGAGDDLTVGELCIPGDIGEVDVAKPADVSLKLETREGAGHLPEPNVTSTRRVEVPWERGRERNVVNLLRERLAAEHDALLVPVPDGDHEVGVVADSGELGAVRAKPAARINLLGAAAQDAHQTQRRVLVHVHVGVCALLSHREVFPGGVHHDHANTTPVDTRQVGLLLGFQVEDLGHVADGEDDHVVCEVRQVITLDGLEAERVVHLDNGSIQLIGPLGLSPVVVSLVILGSLRLGILGTHVLELLGHRLGLVIGFVASGDESLELADNLGAERGEVLVFALLPLLGALFPNLPIALRLRRVRQSLPDDHLHAFGVRDTPLTQLDRGKETLVETFDVQRRVDVGYLSLKLDGFCLDVQELCGEHGYPRLGVGNLAVVFAVEHLLGVLLALGVLSRGLGGGGGGGGGFLVELLGFPRFFFFFFFGGLLGWLLVRGFRSLGSLSGSLGLGRLHLRGVDRLLVLLPALGQLLLDLFSLLVELGLLRDEHLEVRRALVRRARLSLLYLLLRLRRHLLFLLETLDVLPGLSSPVDRLELGRGALLLLGALEVNRLSRIRLRHLGLNLGNLGGRRGAFGSKFGARRASTLYRLELSRSLVLFLGSLERYLLLGCARCRRAHLSLLGPGLGSCRRGLGRELLRLELRHPGARFTTALHGL